MGKIKVNETAFNNAVTYKNNAVSSMSRVKSSAAAVSIPSGFSNAGEVQGILSDISSTVGLNIDNFSQAFLGFANSISILKDSENGVDDLDSRVTRDANGNIIGIITGNGYISLENYKPTDLENGTFYENLW